MTVLSVLDPVRVAEDYATLDHLSGGRLEMIIGKGNDQRHYPLFGISEEEQWDSLAERYLLLKRLWSEEQVTWEGRYRPSLYIANTAEEAIKRYRPYYDAFRSTDSAKHNKSPFKDQEDNIANGPISFGSPDSIIEKIMRYHEAYGHQVLSISVDGLTGAEQREQVERFAKEIAPVLRREIPSTIWSD